MSTDSRTDILTRHIKKIDSKLYCEREHNGMICVYRESHRLENFEYAGQKYQYLKSVPNIIMALTDNWSVRGKPVEWGIEPLMHRLQEIDSWNRGITADDLIDDYEKMQESKDRARMNNHEAWLKDKRSVFKKAFNEINTSNIEKVDRRREREI